MQFINLFPTTISGKTLENITDKEINTFIEYISKLPYETDMQYGKTSLTQNLLDYSIFQNLKKEILISSKNYLNEIDHKFTDIQISCSWANILKKGQKIQEHIHSNSYISGVFYLNKGSNINFFSKLIDFWKFLPDTDYLKRNNFNNKNQRQWGNYKIPPVPKLLLIFPSWLPHSVQPLEEDINRYSIAFNIIPKGEFGEPTQKLYL